MGCLLQAVEIWDDLKQLAKAAANAYNCQGGRRLLAQDTLRLKSSRPPLLLLEVDLAASAAVPVQNRKLLQSNPVDPETTPPEIDLFPDDTSTLPPLACSFPTAESVFTSYVVLVLLHTHTTIAALPHQPPPPPPPKKDQAVLLRRPRQWTRAFLCR